MGLQPWHWAVIGMLLMMGEMFVPSFTMLWFGVAAIITALIAWLMPMGLLSQVIIWLSLSIVACVLWFKLIQPQIKMRTKAGLGGSVIIGEIGMIVSPVMTNGVGVVRFSVPKVGAAEWVCRTLDGHPIEVGTRVIVTAVMGNELIVIPK
ncbi:NfeD family protein [Moraxella canis]|uniref:Uncharacterized protein n=1 Tax=Moraxella canis TaxID=90239 RepID=A0A1S9ZK45_9GAMM|nr:NfeD family protein [Moraxella canis]OOR83826.1 hypothetical protein B0180_05100 [Moraxella canis]